MSIELVKVNRDVSHVYAFWSSSTLDSFLSHIDHTPTVEEKTRVLFTERAIRHVTKQLQDRESGIFVYIDLQTCQLICCACNIRTYMYA